jgi:hypothetical protein
MAYDKALMFHGDGTTATATTMTFTQPQNGVTVDLGSNSINRTLLIERRIASHSGSFLDTTFADSTDNATFSNMPGATGALLGFKRATTSIFSSTDAIAPNAPDRIVIRTDKRYMRMVSSIGTSNNTYVVTVVARVIDGGGAFGSGPLDT